MIRRENCCTPLRHLRQHVYRPRAGHKGSGTQQFLCKVCGAHRVLEAKYTGRRPEAQSHDPARVEVERLSLRAAERVFGAARQTIAKWLGKKADTLPPRSETLAAARKRRRARTR